MGCGIKGCLNRVRKGVSAICTAGILSRDTGKSSDSTVSEVDETYEQALEQELKSIESEPYFRAVDRERAEEILQNRVDGSCLVRPFKENHESIKFIVSVCANGHFFHLFVRRTSKHQFTFGQPKTDEKTFGHPAQIIRFYRLHKLSCTNRETSVRIVLVPID